MYLEQLQRRGTAAGSRSAPGSCRSPSPPTPLPIVLLNSHLKDPSCSRNPGGPTRMKQKLVTYRWTPPASMKKPIALCRQHCPKQGPRCPRTHGSRSARMTPADPLRSHSCGCLSTMATLLAASSPGKTSHSHGKARRCPTPWPALLLAHSPSHRCCRPACSSRQQKACRSRSEEQRARSSKQSLPVGALQSARLAAPSGSARPLLDMQHCVRYWTPPRHCDLQREAPRLAGTPASELVALPNMRAPSLGRRRTALRLSRQVADGKPLLPMLAGRQRGTPQMTARCSWHRQAPRARPPSVQAS
mmetsp:Transcript_129346/g.241986  ORF Transcript_129346/g.241986 Transcript_129346/m.241986 type:complete len:303 (+) Transcript_129346:288-1196(+)